MNNSAVRSSQMATNNNIGYMLVIIDRIELTHSYTCVSCTVCIIIIISIMIIISRCTLLQSPRAKREQT